MTFNINSHSPTDQPDAPLDVQVETGPKEGSLLVTWLPVTITTTGMSNGVLVTGYAVYAEGVKVKEIKSFSNHLIDI